jgi:hypothetical protein
MVWVVLDRGGISAIMNQKKGNPFHRWLELLDATDKLRSGEVPSAQIDPRPHLNLLPWQKSEQNGVRLNFDVQRRIARHARAAINTPDPKGRVPIVWALIVYTLQYVKQNLESECRAR